MDSHNKFKPDEHPQDKATPSFNEISLKLKKHLHAQLALCDSLEDVADSLPQTFDKQMCLHLSRIVLPTIKSAHEFEEKVLFKALASPLGQRAHDNQSQLQSTLQRLEFEHCEDECFGEDIAETLRDLGAGEAFDAEKLGYMLRGFFEGLRRHIAFENEVILPLLEQQSNSQTNKKGWFHD